MSDNMLLTPALFVGIVLGAIFFGGLYWTVKKGLVSTRPALWFSGSLLLRLTITLVGFYVVIGSDWRRLLACLAGFVIARFVITRMTADKMEADHAP